MRILKLWQVIHDPLSYRARHGQPVFIPRGSVRRRVSEKVGAVRARQNFFFFSCNRPPIQLFAATPDKKARTADTHCEPRQKDNIMSTDPTGKGLLLKADVIADAFRDEIVQTLKSLPNPPKLVGILATSAAPSRFYAEFTKKQCEGLGFNFVLKEIGAALNPENGEGYGVEEAIMEANEDDTVHGIMVSGFEFCLLSAG